jgi:hypothetical protein
MLTGWVTQQSASRDSNMQAWLEAALQPDGFMQYFI